MVHTGALGKRMTKVAVVLRIFRNGCIIRDTDIRGNPYHGYQRYNGNTVQYFGVPQKSRSFNQRGAHQRFENDPSRLS